MERKLASIRRISAIMPIEGADKIELATVDGWNVVVARKDGFSVGDLVVYFEIDSLLPICEQYEFLRKGCYVSRSQNGEGFRLKTIKLRGQISQGLIMPIDAFSFPDDVWMNLHDGDDVTEILNVKKYEKIIPPQLAGLAKGNFPSFVPKTDEERIQNCFNDYLKHKMDDFEVSIKLDGSSCTIYLNNDVFGVCSRNLDLKETSDNLYWKIARQYGVEEKLRTLGQNLAIQGEIIGPGVNGNWENIDRHEFHVFNIFYIDSQEYMNASDRHMILTAIGLSSVPIVYGGKLDVNSVADFLDMAEGPSLYADRREGLVFKSINDPSFSFKAISNSYLMSGGE